MIAVIDISLINCHECLNHTGRCTCLKDNQEKAYILSQFYKSLTTNGVIQIINYNYCKNDHENNSKNNHKNENINADDDNNHVTFNNNDMIDKNDDNKITEKYDNTRYNIMNDDDNNDDDDVNRCIIKQVKQVAYEFFNQSIEYKLSKCSKDKARRGYSSLYSENFSSLIGKYNRPNDSVEKYRIGPLISDMLVKKKMMKKNDNININRRKEEEERKCEEEMIMMIMNDNNDRCYSANNDCCYSDNNNKSICNRSNQRNDTQQNPSSQRNDTDDDDYYYHTKDGKIHFYENNMNTISNDFNYYLSKYYIRMDLLSRLIMKLISYCCQLLYYQNFDHLFNKATSILSLNYYPILKSKSNNKYDNNDDNDRYNSNNHVEKRALTSVSSPSSSSSSPSSSSSSLSNTNAISFKHTQHTNVNNDNNNNHKLIRVSEHTDVSLFTIVYQSSQGLEIYDINSHQYIPINYIDDDSMIVNIGDCLQYWSNGLFKSCKHRVVTSLYNNNNREKKYGNNAKNNDDDDINDSHHDENNIDDNDNNDDDDEFDSNNKNDVNNTLNNTFPTNRDDDDMVVVDPDRLSFAFFFTPNYDISLEWPNKCLSYGTINNDDNQHPNSNQDRSYHHQNNHHQNDEQHIEPKMTYSNWRKYHIKKAIQNLK